MPTRPPHPCPTCGTLVAGSSQCRDCHLAHQQARNRRRGDRYNNAYRRARAELLADNPTCAWCGGPADTADHLGPALDDGLVPACRPCNSRRTAQTGHRTTGAGGPARTGDR